MSSSAHLRGPKDSHQRRSRFKGSGQPGGGVVGLGLRPTEAPSRRACCTIGGPRASPPSPSECPSNAEATCRLVRPSRPRLQPRPPEPSDNSPELPRVPIPRATRLKACAPSSSVWWRCLTGEPRRYPAACSASLAPALSAASRSKTAARGLAGTLRTDHLAPVHAPHTFSTVSKCWRNPQSRHRVARPAHGTDHPAGVPWRRCADCAIVAV